MGGSKRGKRGRVRAGSTGMGILEHPRYKIMVWGLSNWFWQFLFRVQRCTPFVSKYKIIFLNLIILRMLVMVVSMLCYIKGVSYGSQYVMFFLKHLNHMSNSCVNWCTTSFVVRLITAKHIRSYVENPVCVGVLKNITNT